MSETTQSLASGIADPKVSETRSIKRKRILLVEGDGFTRLVLLLRFRMAGFEVHFTSNGTLALGKLGNCHPDALLVELQLRGVSGLELIRAARRAPEFGNRPIYVFTCSDLMNRATRKEVRSLATKVFDKRSITLESLVRGVAGMLTPPQETGEPRHATAAEQPAP